jgi:hypothetical protein
VQIGFGNPFIMTFARITVLPSFVVDFMAVVYGELLSETGFTDADCPESIKKLT